MVTFLMITHWHWWGLAALLILGELLAPCFYFMAIALAAGLLGLIVRFVPELSGTWQLIIFAMLAGISLLLARHLKIKRQAASLSTPTDTDH